jgi:DNA repair exonuclease SbcCD nuclease subunit
VHCSDVHLETTFPDTRGGARRRGALADAFARIVDEALARDADVLTVGGDLYESERAGPQTVRFLFEQFARFGRPVFLAPGNHDPYAPGSLLARDDLPANVRIFNETAWRAFPLAPNVTLWGFGHSPAEPGRPFANAKFDRDGVQLALVHGSDEERCPPKKRATAPFTTAEIATSGASLALVGHYHGGYVGTHEGRPIVAYPGSPEPIKFGENDVHGALHVTIGDAGDIAIEPIAIARTRALELRCDLHGIETDRAALAALRETLSGCGADDYVRVRLAGSVAPGTRIDPIALADEAGGALGSLEILDETTAYDYESIAREPTVRGHVVRDLLDLLRERETKAAAAASPASSGLALALEFELAPDVRDVRDALRYALAAFDGSEIVP